MLNFCSEFDGHIGEVRIDGVDSQFYKMGRSVLRMAIPDIHANPMLTKLFNSFYGRIFGLDIDSLHADFRDCLPILVIHFLLKRFEVS